MHSRRPCWGLLASMCSSLWLFSTTSWWLGDRDATTAVVVITATSPLGSWLPVWWLSIIRNLGSIYSIGQGISRGVFRYEISCWYLTRMSPSWKFASNCWSQRSKSWNQRWKAENTKILTIGWTGTTRTRKEDRSCDIRYYRWYCWYGDEMRL